MFTFCKEERLCNKKSISSLFKKGKSFFIYPFNIRWNIINLNSNYPAQILISIPKRNFKKAVDRNTLKRIIRESYRLNKQILGDNSNNNNKTINFTLIYTGKEILNLKLVQEKIILILHRLRIENEKVAN